MITALTPQVEQAILDAVRKGASVATAARAAGINPETIRRWRNILNGASSYPNGARVDPSSIVPLQRFMEALAQARAETLAKLNEKLMYNASTLNEKTGWYDTQAIRILASHNPDNHEEFFERRHVEMNGTVTHREEQQHALEVYDTLGLDGLAQLEQMLPSPSEEGQG